MNNGTGEMQWSKLNKGIVVCTYKCMYIYNNNNYNILGVYNHFICLPFPINISKAANYTCQNEIMYHRLFFTCVCK